MTPADWRELATRLQALGLQVVHIDRTSGQITVRVPGIKKGNT